MATKIFTNGDEGKVLTSVGNRIIKQPYEFGNGFSNMMGLNNYIKVTGLDFSSKSYTLLDWHNQRGVAAMDGGNMFQSADNYIDQLHIRASNTEVSQSQTAFMGMSNELGLKLYAITASPTSLTVSRNLVKYALDTTVIPQKQFVNVYLGARNSSISNATATAVNVYSSAGYTYSTIVLYDRVLSDDEIRYFYANKLGNDPQSLQGVIFYMRRDFAEVINIGGVDQPCVRDYSGNNKHGIIMDLPAGTAEYKVDYANANLFVTFQ